MSILIRILTLCSWALVGCLVYFLVHIARFYEKKYAELYDDAPKKRTFYQLFFIPLFLFLIAAGRYMFCGDFVGDEWGDLAFFVGGLVLIASGYRLQRLMTGGRR